MLPFAWKDYLKLAKELSKRNEEECKRTAISRAYYAAFRSAHDWYENKYPGSFPAGGNRSHTVVWAAFQDPIHSADPRYALVGTLGNRLKYSRVDADYWLTFPGKIAYKLTKALTDAEDIITTLDSLPK